MKKLYYSLVVIMLAMLSSCASKMGELSPEYFTVTPQVLEAVGGKVPATINGRFPEKYFNKKAIVEVTPVLRWQGGEVGYSCGGDGIGEFTQVYICEHNPAAFNKAF